MQLDGRAIAAPVDIAGSGLNNDQAAGLGRNRRARFDSQHPTRCKGKGGSVLNFQRSGAPNDNLTASGNHRVIGHIRDSDQGEAGGQSTC